MFQLEIIILCPSYVIAWNSPNHLFMVRVDADFI